jgi:hypothetical protein
MNRAASHLRTFATNEELTRVRYWSLIQLLRVANVTVKDLLKGVLVASGSQFFLNFARTLRDCSSDCVLSVHEPWIDAFVHGVASHSKKIRGNVVYTMGLLLQCAR